MCYHNTYLFSLCGHTTYSELPIRHTAQCANTAAKPAKLSRPSTPLPSSSISAYPDLSPIESSPLSPRLQEDRSLFLPNSAQRISYAANSNSTSIIDIFPSPQEFEFAKQLHDSVPASPLSPTVVRQQKQQRQQQQRKEDTEHFDASTNITQTQEGNDSRLGEGSNTLNLLDQQQKLSARCPEITRHPLRTYLVPLLCPACRSRRELNIARFEAQAIRESVERKRGLCGITQTRGGIIDVERKKISRRRRREGADGKDCGLIPLICVEERRIREMEHEGERHVAAGSDGHGEDVDDGAACEGDSHIGGEVLKGVENEFLYKMLPSDSQAAAKAAMTTNVQERESETHHNPSSLAVSAFASSWRWWGRGTAVSDKVATLPSQVASPQLPSPPLTPIAAAVESQRNQLDPLGIDTGPSTVLTSVVHAESEPVETVGKAGGKIDWTGVQERWRGINKNIARDVFGRNVEGVNRIIGWIPEHDKHTGIKQFTTSS